MFQWIRDVIEWLKGKEKVEYPQDFYLIDFSPIALQFGLKTNRNKIIYRYFLNSFGNIELKKYRYSEERIKALEEVHKTPGYDKTRKEVRFPVFSRILPGEVRFTQAR